MTRYSPIEFWNAYAEKRGLSWNEPSNYTEMDNLISMIREYLDPEAKILDVGSGWGRFLKRCRTKKLNNVKVSMCDISQEYIKLAIKKTGVVPTWWDGKTLPYEDDSFDLVISQSCMLHIKPYNVKRVWMEHVRVSKKYLYIATATPERTPERLAIDRKGEGHCYAHNYAKLIKDSGLEIIKEASYSEGRRTSWLFKKN